MTALSDTRTDPEAAHGNRLTPEAVVAIAERIAAGERHTAIAAAFGVSVETVGAIKSGKRWASAVDDELRRRMQAATAGAALNAARALEVMAALEVGRPGRSIADEFGISPSMVSAIRRGQAWGSLDPSLPARLAQEARSGKALSVSQVAAIKRRLLGGWSSRKIASEFGVSASTISAISRGATWADVTPGEAGEDS